MPPRRKLFTFTMRMVADDLRKLQKLAKLEGEGMSTVVRSAIRREYETKIGMKR